MEKKNMPLTQEERLAWLERYNAGIHREGRIWTLVCLLVLLAVPFVMGLVLKAKPDMNSFLKGFFNVAIIYYPTSLVEYLIYVPMLGPGASYLSFITGNLSNLKIPCAVNAREMADARVGTPENEIISTLSVATSSLVTVVVLALGVLLLVPLQPVLMNPVLTPAFDNVVPALFGALGLKYFSKSLKLSIPPLALMSALCVFVPSLISQTSVMMIPVGAMALALGFVLWKKDML